jgi:polyhydroxyalkanoate synthase subunit PhaC
MNSPLAPLNALPMLPVSPEDLAARVANGMQAQLAQASGGLAPDDYLRAWNEWALQVAGNPGQQRQLATEAIERSADLLRFALQAAQGQPLAPETPDKRFAGAGWDQYPFNVLARGYAHLQKYSEHMLANTQGLAPATAQRLDFLMRQALDVVSPAHYLATNPELLELTRSEGGANLVRGYQNWLEDVLRMVTGDTAPRAGKYKVGEQVAVTPGKVVMRNELVELIQYSPQGASVYAEPVLVTPAWIMKYYILDLSAHNSLVNYLVAQGHTVFMISWRNPSAADRALGMDDYVRLGLRAALDAVTAICPERGVHAVGYCIGGTLLSIGAAALAAAGDRRIATVTLFAAQVDFSEPGELSVFITPSQIAMLQAVMERDGVLTSERMGAAFAMLRSADLIWAPMVNQYLKGQRIEPNDLMAWNADGTRMPARMHSDYLERLYLKNQLAKGEFTVEGAPVHLKDITVPMFVVGTETDHVAPWLSVYKARALTASRDYSFVLTSGGHNAGIISGASNAKRRHRVMRWQDDSSSVSPDVFQQAAEMKAGSWWPTWQRWLAEHSSNVRTTLPTMGNAAAGYPPLCDAPGEYVRG